MTHDGYVATIDLDEDAGLFHGEVINTRDVLTFQGRTIDELKAAFADTLADYIDWCRGRGKEPERPYSGNFTVRISPELHRHGCRPQRQERQHIRRRDTGAVGVKLTSRGFLYPTKDSILFNDLGPRCHSAKAGAQGRQGRSDFPGPPLFAGVTVIR
jgi:predicted HicB family RNase H-like nuclease